MVVEIGILALQGNYAQHEKVLDELSVSSVLVKYPNQLNGLSGLIIPGGESSVISRHIEKNNFRDAIKDFSNVKPIFGTCAGMILLSSTKKTKHVNPLSLMDFTVKRNAWGRQVNSFFTNIMIDSSIDKSFKGYFIRAPKVKDTNSSINVLASHEGEPVMLSDGFHLASSFHPEIGGNNKIHKYFIDKIHDEK